MDFVKLDRSFTFTCSLPSAAHLFASAYPYETSLDRYLKFTVTWYDRPALSCVIVSHSVSL